MKPALIVDLDSTLCNTKHRDHLASSKQWEEFYSGCSHDTINDWCLKLLDAMHFMYPVLNTFFITGRPERTRDKTVDWLMKNLPNRVWYNALLFMRPDTGWSGRTVEFKRETYLKEIKDKFNVIFALDDDIKCVNMWRLETLICLQPEDNDF